MPITDSRLKSKPAAYTYDGNGLLKTTTRPDGSVEIRTYDAAGQLTQINDRKADETLINQLDYTYDAVGNLTAETRTDPAGTVTYEYDELNRMTEYTDVYSNTLQYDYDEAGNLTAETTLQPPGATVMTYGADNRLDPYNGQPVAYDDDGNMTQGPLAGDMVNFTFDSRSRLTGAGDTSYTYDANNNRVSVSAGVYQTSYTVNPNALLSQVLTATDDSDNKTYYVYGLGLIGQESPDGSYKSYHFDSRGSTVALTDDAGEITDRYDYGPYGEIIQQSGATENIFLYVGQYGVVTDDNGLYQMRARYYNPEIKAFINEDDLAGNIKDGLTLNRYAYAQGNPIIYVDPSGHYYVDPQALYEYFVGTYDISGLQNPHPGPVYQRNAEYVQEVNQIDPKFTDQLNEFKIKYEEKNYAVYKRISGQAGIPVQLVAAIHYREASGDLNSSIRDGSSLGNDSFEDDAVQTLSQFSWLRDACNLSANSNDMVGMLAFAEAYNGTGYYDNNRVSPYTFSGTNLYTMGKYDYDGHYDPKLVDLQPGVYLILRALKGCYN